MYSLLLSRHVDIIEDIRCFQWIYGCGICELTELKQVLA